MLEHKLVVRALTVRGLAPVSFTLNAGECVAVRGPSGSGKSLLLRAIADLDPNTGMLTLSGRDRDAFPAPEWRRHVGYVPAEPGWWSDHVAEHFQDWDEARCLVERMGLTVEAGAWPVLRLSSGERMRLALIRALLVQPEVLLLDEPTGPLDSTATAAVEELIAERRAQGLAVLWVTHDDAQAARIARRCLVVDGGRIKEVIL
jgi:putative ABC transport system ATP-binding protein